MLDDEGGHSPPFVIGFARQPAAPAPDLDGPTDA
jgi:hypothetical protein